jgi:hypothetical protein
VFQIEDITTPAKSKGKNKIVVALNYLIKNCLQRRVGSGVLAEPS